MGSLERERERLGENRGRGEEETAQQEVADGGLGGPRWAEVTEGEKEGRGEENVVWK